MANKHIVSDFVQHSADSLFHYFFAAMFVAGIAHLIADEPVGDYAPVPPADYAAFTYMPPPAENPSEYISMWDPFSLREPDSAMPLEVTAASARVSMNVEIFPANGRQIARDDKGRWYILVEQDNHTLYLGVAASDETNPYRPRGGDFDMFELVGEGSGALLPSSGKIKNGSMVVDPYGQVHVAWADEDGIWHAMTEVTDDLRSTNTWSTVSLAEGPALMGDIMVDVDGDVVLAYAREDTIYYHPITASEPELVTGPSDGLPPLGRPGSRIPDSERVSQNVVMDRTADGTVWLAFRRDFAVWVVMRTPDGEWGSPERIVREYVFHPSIIIHEDRPLITFQHEGVREVPFGDDENYLRQRGGGGSSLAYARLTNEGWSLGTIISAEEILVRRSGIHGQRFEGRMVPHIEQFGWPALFRDGRGVVWVAWQNTSRRWAYSARWLGEGFGEIQELRGPFYAPSRPILAEKQAPVGAGDLGLLFFAAERAYFDRLWIPSLSVAEDREILFLDALEVAETEGLELVLNQAEKDPANPLLSPKIEENLLLRGPAVAKRGDTYVMRYSRYPVDSEVRPGYGQVFGYAISSDGIHFERVDELPDGLGEEEVFSKRPLAWLAGDPDYNYSGVLENPDASDPEKKYTRLRYVMEQRGLYYLDYSPDGKKWTEATRVPVMSVIRERGRPGFYDPDDPERPIRLYGRTYTETGRAWGVVWTKDLLKWSGFEHHLDADDPYGQTPPATPIHPTSPYLNVFRPQTYFDSVAGDNEDQIYVARVRKAEGIYFNTYWPGRMGIPNRDISLAVSRDGFNFIRVKRGRPLIPLGNPGEWDSGIIGWLSPRYFGGDDMWLYYFGGAYTRKGSGNFNHHLTELGLARLRVNGWTYFTPEPGRKGILTTIPVDSVDGGRGLRVNIEGVLKSGDFSVEVLDASNGQAIPGYTTDDFEPLIGDGLAVPVRWSKATELPSGRDIRLRFHLNSPGVKLYSFGFEDT